MTSTPADRRPVAWSVGARVRTRHSRDTDLAPEQWPVVSGVIVDDFGDGADPADSEYGRDWAHKRRWAIALDSGSLIFRNDAELAPDS
ncbi:hypothetical protein [Antrihabitans cavernicola]|uniref:Uncharacterized protein n=1 Tax=Antrihabitans cavernicola TaxID=2495913 RepID=A0A5A7SDG8_9NOCA|nr:hypothetical protein [Spelaeibacter cavernicola]KAA0022261.1 hypothetical protein FOY51_14870 [Spelaeibacter cavernicola]